MNTRGETEEKIIARVKSGDDDAFAHLVESYKNKVFSLAYRILFSWQEAEDVSQEAFIKVYRRLNSFDPKRAGFSTWLYRITYNLCVDYLRKRKYQTTLEEDFAAEDAKGPEQKAIESEQSQKLLEAVSSLSEEYRTPLMLFHFHGLSYQEICEVLDVPMSIVKNRLFRARKILKQMLERGDKSGM
jgi:RNA polymerase sigma-70 factor (ECF subfamily)